MQCCLLHRLSKILRVEIYSAWVSEWKFRFRLFKKLVEIKSIFWTTWTNAKRICCIFLYDRVIINIARTVFGGCFIDVFPTCDLEIWHNSLNDIFQVCVCSGRILQYQKLGCCKFSNSEKQKMHNSRQNIFIIIFTGNKTIANTFCFILFAMYQE